MRFQKGREWKLPDLVYTDNFILCGESEEDLKVVGHFVEVCRKRDPKVNENKSKVIVLDGEEGSICEAYLQGTQLEHLSV